MTGLLAAPFTAAPRPRLVGGLLAAGILVWVALWPAAGQVVGERDEGAASRLFEEAGRLEREGDLEGALREYRLLVDRFSATGLVPEALLREAQIQRRLGRTEDAGQTASELASRYPASPAAAGASVLRAEIAIAAATAPDQLEEARAALRRVPLLFGAERYPRLEWRSVARVLAGEVGIRLGDLEAAAASLVSAIEDEASAVAARARVGFATILLKRGEWEAAAQTLQEASRGPGETAQRARSLLTLIYRLKIRPAAGTRPWTSARLLRPAGAELEKPTAVSAVGGRVAIVADRASVTVVDPSGAIQGRHLDQDVGRPWWDGRNVLDVPVEEGVAVPAERERWTFSYQEGGKVRTLGRIVAGARGGWDEWFLLDEREDGVLVFGPGRDFRKRLVLPPKSHPVDVAVDTWGQVFVLDRSSGAIHLFGDHGSRLFARGDWRKPAALDVDLLGDVYLLDEGTKLVRVFDPGGHEIAVLGPSLPDGVTLGSPEDLAVDATGRVYLADRKLDAVVVLE